jgi:hypothetical protein
MERISVMWCYWEREWRVEGSGCGATVPVGTVQVRGRGPAVRVVRGAGNVGRRTLLMAGKREDFSF